MPGRPDGNGPDGHSIWPALPNVPNEFLEASFPLRIREYATIPDSGSTDLHRGGNAIVIAYEMGAKPMRVHVDQELKEWCKEETGFDAPPRTELPNQVEKAAK